MSDIIIGTEAVAGGVVTSHGLRRRYRPIYPNVHAPAHRELSLRDRAEGAWLWSRRQGIITGLAASALHGSHWVDADATVELLFNCTRPPDGIVSRNERIAVDEWREVEGLPVTTPARTAFDLGRFQPEYQALARLDALMRARPYSIDDVMSLATRYKGARGVARLKALLPLVDGGSESPRESWWRKLVIDSGFPTPVTQLCVRAEDSAFLRRLDFGWEDYKVAIEYDGDQHQTDRAQYLKDRQTMPVLRRLNWHVISIVKEDDPVEVLRSLNRAMRARGWLGQVQVPAYAWAYARRLAENASRAAKTA